MPPNADPYPILRFFRYEHEPEHLHGMLDAFASLAEKLTKLASGAETATALRKLLESRDAALRAAKGA